MPVYRGSLPGLFLLLLCVACTPPKPTFTGMDITGVDWGGEVTLQGHTGKPVSTMDFRGKLLVLFFGYTHCPDICAPTLAKLAALRGALGPEGEGIQVFFITVDPAHDSAQQLASFVPTFDSSFIGLTGNAEEIAAVMRDYKISAVPRQTAGSASAQIDHSGTVFVKDGAGRLRLLWKSDMPVSDMEHDVRLLMQMQNSRVR